jgi:hypothetical protein
VTTTRAAKSRMSGEAAPLLVRSGREQDNGGVRSFLPSVLSRGPSSPEWEMALRFWPYGSFFPKNSLVLQCSPHINELGIVYSQQGYCHASDPRSPGQLGSIPPKVLGPYVASGMEQTDNLLSIGIDTCYIRSFETIAVDARQREILKLRSAPMLSGNDVIDLERRRVKRRWQLTVLTTIRCTLPDSLNEISVQNVLLSRML